MKRLTQEEIAIVDAQPKPVQTEGGWIYPDEPTRIYSDRYTAICARANRIGAMFNCRPGYARWHQVRSRLSIWAVGFYPAVVREVPS